MRGRQSDRQIYTKIEGRTDRHKSKQTKASTCQNESLMITLAAHKHGGLADYMYSTQRGYI